jgi:hypothetical protein
MPAYVKADGTSAAGKYNSFNADGTPVLTDVNTTVAVGAPRCVTCHSQNSTAYKNNFYTVKSNAVHLNNCFGCHADKVGAVDHFTQMGGK